MTSKIDSVDYDTDKLSDEAKAQLVSLQFCDQELARLQAQAATLHTVPMELTIEQALQQAVEAHKAGKLQDAEALYRAILQAQPKHPDANHNLGVLAVSLNKSELALPLFKIAPEVNLKQVQFWICYIDKQTKNTG